MVSSTLVVSIIALLVGLVWVHVNLYTYAPVYRKAFLRLVGQAKDPRVFDTGTTLPEADLPTIDVLLPAYDERETIGHAIEALREADYPAEKLSIHVLVEAADGVTRNELARLERRHDFRELVVPPSYPGARNKPRALNYGFEHTDGDIVGVIDAEDLVAPDLFRQVVAALDGGHDYVQGRLDMQNEGDGLLNTLFRGEYGYWYRAIVPSYFRVRYPVPLGGTTNFAWRAVLAAAADTRSERFGPPWTEADRETLVDAGWSAAVPWDPRNVTEDFELGLLLWESGYSMAMVTAITREESPVGVNSWIRQRTRWQKGKLYTFAQRLRSPPAGLRRKLHVYTQSAMPHLGPINIVGVVTVGIYATVVGFLASPVVAIVLLLGMAFVVQQLVMQAIGYWVATDTRGFTRARRTAYNFLGLPLYWLLLWGADVRAFVQLAFDQLDWEKTAHAGRHIRSDASAEDHDPTADTPRAVVFEGTDGWTWELRDGDTPIAAAAGPFGSSADASADLQSVLSVLPTAVDTSLLFRIRGDETGWTWRLADEDVLAVGPAAFSDAAAARQAVGRTKTAAGLAVVRRSAASEPTVAEDGPRAATLSATADSVTD